MAQVPPPVSRPATEPMKHLLLSFLLLWPAASSAASTVDIYWIDVEGGAATLIVTQAGETVLIDAGWPGFGGRDAKRIERVLTKEAKAEKIDYFITSHFHLDHVGGLPQLAKKVPIDKFVDHGDSVETDLELGKKLWDSYLAVAQGKRMQVRAGDRLPLKGVEMLIVAARSVFIQEPRRPPAANPLCKTADLREEDRGENGKSIGFVLRVGNFEFLDLGDLTWNYEYQLACPRNLLGEIDLYQVTHHGMDMSGSPQHVWAIRPTVAVMNNGPTKGGRPQVYEMLMQSPGIEDLWQLHRAIDTDAAHNTDENLIANLAETDKCRGHWIKAAVAGDGSYTVSNSRNGFSKTYQAR